MECSTVKILLYLRKKYQIPKYIVVKKTNTKENVQKVVSNEKAKSLFNNLLKAEEFYSVYQRTLLCPKGMNAFGWEELK